MSDHKEFLISQVAAHTKDPQKYPPAPPSRPLFSQWRVVAGMPWPASCRHCDLITEDPDAYFLPPDWDEDDLPEGARCPATDFQMGHEVRTLEDFRLVLVP